MGLRNEPSQIVQIARSSLEAEVARLQAVGATIEGDLTSGYIARWQEGGLLVRDARKLK